MGWIKRFEPNYLFNHPLVFGGYLAPHLFCANSPGERLRIPTRGLRKEVNQQYVIVAIIITQIRRFKDVSIFDLCFAGPLCILGLGRLLSVFRWGVLFFCQRATGRVFRCVPKRAWKVLHEVAGA